MDGYIVIGALSNLLFGLKSFPQVLKCYKQKSTNGLSLTMILCDFGGNIGCSYYLYSTVKFAVVFQHSTESEQESHVALARGRNANNLLY